MECGDANDRTRRSTGTWWSSAAGPAGLCAAIRAAERGARVLLVEKNRRPGVKILMSGGTRCNLTNARGLRSLAGVSGPIDPAYDPRQAQGRGASSRRSAPAGRSSARR